MWAQLVEKDFMAIKGIIALDADGVLLDYGLAYAGAWQKAFGQFPPERDPLAYWPTDRWDVECLAQRPPKKSRCSSTILLAR
jgi:beta-phosphoglucomutase-like phosphatase (HAD superfamily)